jgi:hypothetical protein
MRLKIKMRSLKVNGTGRGLSYIFNGILKLKT